MTKIYLELWKKTSPIKSRARTRVPLNLDSELGKENNELDLNFENMLFTCDYSQYSVMLNTFAYSKEQLGGCSLIPSSVIPVLF